MARQQPELSGVTGAFFEQRAEIACELRGDAGEERLWAACEQLVGALASKR